MMRRMIDMRTGWNRGWRTMLVDGTKLPRSRRIAAKARCHDENGCGQRKGMRIGL